MVHFNPRMVCVACLVSALAWAHATAGADDVTSQPLSPAAGLKSLHVPDGYRVELVAAEPLVMDPVAFDWGADGKLWVAEMADYPLGMDGKGPPGGRVRYLQDLDGDGKYDKSTLFLDGVGFPSGVMAWRDGVLVTAAPEVFFARDTNGDGKCDERTTLFEGFGEGNQQHRVNGLRWSMDGWVHLANGDSGGKIRSTKTGTEIDISGRDLRIRPDEGLLETVTGASQFGRDRDDFGRWIGCNNSVPCFDFVLEDRYLRRNRDFAPPSPKAVAVGNGPVYPLSRTVARFNFPESANQFTSACGSMIYRDELLGKDVAGNFFVCEPVHNLVHRELLSRPGLSFRSQRAAGEEQAEFLRSTDNWFRPVMIRTGPDGGLWVADMYRKYLEHPEWIPDDIEATLDLRAGHEKGRIYRVVPTDKPARAIVSLDTLDVLALVNALDASSGTERDRVQQSLLSRADQGTIKPLLRLAKQSKLPATRAQALWTLAQLQKLHTADLVAALADTDPRVRAEAIKIAESRLAESPAVGLKLIALCDDPHPDVQLQLAYTLGEWNDPQAAEALGRLAVEHCDDPYLAAAVYSSVTPSNLTGIFVRILSAKKYDLLEPLLSFAAVEGNEALLSRTLDMLCSANSEEEAEGRMRCVGRALATLRRRGKSYSEIVPPELSDRVTAMCESARELALDEAAEDSRRIVAIQLVAANLRDDNRLAVVSELLAPRQSGAVQTAAIAALNEVGSEAAAVMLLDGWDTFSAAPRAQVLDALLSRPEWALLLLRRIDEGAISAAQLDAAARQRMLENGAEEVRTEAEKLLSADLGARADVVAQYQSVRDLPGDLAIGREVFLKRCAVCHIVDGKGHAVGANLAAIGNKSTDALLVAILDPNRAVEARYMNYIAQLEDGRQASGMLSAESGESLTLRGQEGKEQVILRKQLGKLRNTGKSLMPEGLEKDLTMQDLANLITFVQSQGSPRTESPLSHPEVVQADEQGVISLAATTGSLFGPTLVVEKANENLGMWFSPDDRVEWSFTAPKDGLYEVRMNYACDPNMAGNQLRLELEGQRLDHDVAGTSGWDDYREVVIGRLELQAGNRRLAVSPGRIVPKKALLDLHSLSLVPIATSK